MSGTQKGPQAPECSVEKKEECLRKMLAPFHVPVENVHRESGVPVHVLVDWLKTIRHGAAAAAQHFHPMPIADAQSANACNRLPKPNRQQLAMQDLELGLFIHFGMNTFTGESAGNGRSDPSTFNPTDLDCGNWMETARAMGARFAVLTTRHEEGFCLWPTRTTDYSIALSPYKNGRGDIVREFVDACRANGIVPCFYHASYMDAHHTFQAEDSAAWYRDWFTSMARRLAEPRLAERFAAMQEAQIRELLTEYGEIGYLWLDHIGETESILDPVAVGRFWGRIVEAARKCQPKCLLLGCDVGLSQDLDQGGSVHSGRAAYPLWHAVKRDVSFADLGFAIPDPVNGETFLTWETNTVFSGGWFWNGDQVKPVDEMVDHYHVTVGRGAYFLPNFAPDPQGRMTGKVLAHARAFGDRIRAIYANPLAAAENAGGVIELALPAEPFIHVEIMEDMREGQKIGAYMLDIRRNGAWSTLAEGESVAHKHLHKVPPTQAEAIRFTCTRSFAEPVQVRKFAVYGAA